MTLSGAQSLISANLGLLVDLGPIIIIALILSFVLALLNR